MNKVVINNNLLALFLEGKTTKEETLAVLEAAINDLEIRYTLKYAIDGLLSMPSILDNQSVCCVGEKYKLHSRHLPVMRLAASGEANDCVVKCEEYVLNKFGKESLYKKLVKKARRHNWLHKNGTPLYNIGRLSELATLSVSRRFGGSLEMLQKDIEGGCSIIVALNAESLTTRKNRSTTEANHAVVVLDVNLTEEYVEVYDPQSSSESDIYSFNDFTRAWKCSKNFWVSIVERGVRPYVPHPENVEHIKLPKSIVPLADMLAENAHDIWAKDRLAEAEKKKAKGKDINPYDDPYMKPFKELTLEEKDTDYSTALNSIKLLYKFGLKITCADEKTHDYKPNIRTSDGQYIPNPINVDDVVLPKEIEELTEYIAENAHEEWAKQRIKEGWIFAPKTNKKFKLSFCLVPYCELLDSEKEYDRKMAMNTLKVLYKLGYRIEKVKRT